MDDDKWGFDRKLMREAEVSLPSPLLLFKAVPGTGIGANHTGRIYSFQLKIQLLPSSFLALFCVLAGETTSRR